MILTPKRYNASYLNNRIEIINNKIIDLTNSSLEISHIRTVNINQHLARDNYTRHGLHLNRSGKAILAKLVHNAIRPNFARQVGRPLKNRTSAHTLRRGSQTKGGQLHTTPSRSTQMRSPLRRSTTLARLQRHGCVLNNYTSTHHHTSSLMKLQICPPILNSQTNLTGTTPPNGDCVRHSNHPCPLPQTSPGKHSAYASQQPPHDNLYSR